MKRILLFSLVIAGFGCEMHAPATPKPETQPKPTPPAQQNGSPAPSFFPQGGE